jgi:hypothetical protein
VNLEQFTAEFVCLRPQARRKVFAACDAYNEVKEFAY